MKNKQAFTLIELLVVVLIIGILAAVALPQYRIAVEKARAAEVMTVLKSMREAEERYYLANGRYTTNFEELDLSLPGTVWASNQIRLPSGWKIVLHDMYVYAQNKSDTNTFVFLYMYINDSTKGKRTCYAKQNNTIANQVCKSLGGSSPHNEASCSIGACTVYIL